MDAELDQAEAVLDGLARTIVPGCLARYGSGLNPSRIVIVTGACSCFECERSQSDTDNDQVWLIDDVDLWALDSELTRI